MIGGRAAPARKAAAALGSEVGQSTGDKMVGGKSLAWPGLARPHRPPLPGRQGRPHAGPAAASQPPVLPVGGIGPGKVTGGRARAAGVGGGAGILGADAPQPFPFFGQAGAGSPWGRGPLRGATVVSVCDVPGPPVTRAGEGAGRSPFPSPPSLGSLGTAWRSPCWSQFLASRHRLVFAAPVSASG